MAERSRRSDPQNRYRDRVSPQTEEAFGLNNVRGFDRPMASGPRDVLIGQDELGNSIYRTILGTQYTVRPATPEESKTTRARVEDWVDEGMPLPSKDEALETAKAIPGAVYDSMQNTLDGTATMGEAVGWAPAMGAASLPFDVPEGSLRIFGGRNAVNSPTVRVNYSAVPDLDMYTPEVREAVYKLPATANYSDFKDYFWQKLGEPQDPNETEILAQEAMALKNAAEAIAKQNAGWSMGADGKPRFEIDDSRAVYLGQFAEIGEPTTLEAVFDHADLYYQYPELKDIEVTLKPMEGALLGQYNPGEKTIELNSNRSPEEIKSTLLHEIQHAVQQIEGFDGGSNTFAAGLYGPTYEANSPEAKTAWDQYLTSLRDLPRVREEKFKNFAERLSGALDEFEKNVDVSSLLTSPFVDFEMLQESLERVRQGRYSNVDREAASLLSLLTQLQKNQDLTRFLSTQFSPEEVEQLSSMQLTGNRDLDPYNQNFRDRLFQVETPKEPILLDPRDPSGYFNMARLYRRNMGEVEARNVEARQNMTKAERLANPPRQTEDIPRGFQWANPQRFAEGGLVDQTQFAFMNEGGMVDDGATVEPTTGNEVPPGSLKEEVADTIDAKLSVGEYVVPADVVQYYGVAHFEKLRQKAKEGLAQMEANGRIGGDPAEDELPFSDEELMTEDGAEGSPQGFAEGGLAWGSPQMTGLTGTGTETVTYVGPDGSKLPILFINGQPIQQIPQGYVPEGQQKQPQASFKSVRPTVTQGEGDSAINTMQPKPVAEWAVEDFERYSNSQGMMDVVSKLPVILGPGGMIMGGLMNKAYQMQGQQALKEIDTRLSSTELDDQSRQRLQAVRENLKARAEEPSQGVLGGGLFKGLTGGNGIMERLFGTGVQTTAQPSGIPVRPEKTPDTRSAPRLASSSEEGSPLAPTTSPRPASRSAPPASTPSQTPQSTNRTPSVSKEQKSSIQEANKASGAGTFGGPSGGFAEGGFVKRRNKR